MKKCKVLCCYYTDGSGYVPVRVYTDYDFDKAEADLKLMKEHASDTKTWILVDAELYDS